MMNCEKPNLPDYPGLSQIISGFVNSLIFYLGLQILHCFACLEYSIFDMRSLDNIQLTLIQYRIEGLKYSHFLGLIYQNSTFQVTYPREGNSSLSVTVTISAVMCVGLILAGIKSV